MKQLTVGWQLGGHVIAPTWNWRSTLGDGLYALPQGGRRMQQEEVNVAAHGQRLQHLQMGSWSYVSNLLRENRERLSK